MCGFSCPATIALAVQGSTCFDIAPRNGPGRDPRRTPIADAAHQHTTRAGYTTAEPQPESPCCSAPAKVQKNDASIFVVASLCRRSGCQHERCFVASPATGRSREEARKRVTDPLLNSRAPVPCALVVLSAVTHFLAATRRFACVGGFGWPRAAPGL